MSVVDFFSCILTEEAAGVLKKPKLLSLFEAYNISGMPEKYISIETLIGGMEQ